MCEINVATDLFGNISDWPRWKLDALMLDESDIKIRNEIEKYKQEVKMNEHDKRISK